MARAKVVTWMCAATLVCLLLVQVCQGQQQPKLYDSERQKGDGFAFTSSNLNGSRSTRALIKEFITKQFKAVTGVLSDRRIKWVYIGDIAMVISALLSSKFLDGYFKEISLACCAYFMTVGTLSGISYIAMDRPDLVDMQTSDYLGKFCLAIIVLATVGIIVIVLQKVLEGRQREAHEAAARAAAMKETQEKSLSQQLADDVMACKESSQGLLKLLDYDQASLQDLSPEDIGEELSHAIRSLVSFVKLANMTILGNEVPIQILYEKHVLDKDVAIAFHTMDSAHKQVLAATATILEHYFLRTDDGNQGGSKKHK